MTFYAALDVSLDKTAVCVMGRDGSIVREIEVATCPETLARCLGKIAPAFELVGLEAGPMSEWLVRGLANPLSLGEQHRRRQVLVHPSFLGMPRPSLYRCR